MLIVLVMPIVQILLFGLAISTEVRDAVVDIVGDPDDATIREIAPKLEHNTSTMPVPSIQAKYSNALSMRGFLSKPLSSLGT